MTLKGRSLLHSESEASLAYMRRCLKSKDNNNNGKQPSSHRARRGEPLLLDARVSF